MNTVIEKLMLTDAEGNNFDTTREEYQKAIIKELGVKPFENKEAGKTIEVGKVMDHITKNLMKGLDLDEALASAYPEVVERVRADLKKHEENVAGAKAAAGKTKEEKDKEKALKEIEDKKAAEALALRQGEVLTNAKAGIETAQGEFKDQIGNLSKAIPESITVVNEGNGFGLKFAEGTTDEEAGKTLGYFIQSSINNEFMGNQIKFFLGDMILWYNQKGIYATAKEAGEAVNALLPPNEKQVPSMLDQWKRTAERTPIALRNPHVQPTAYLAVANMKLPKKGDKETDAEFAKRMEAFKADRTGLLEKLSSGEVAKRGDILQPIEDTLIKHGLKEKKSDEDTIPVGQYYKIYFQADMALKHFVGAHEKGKVIYKEGENKYELAKEELEALRDDAESNLSNIVFDDKKAEVTFKNLVEGTKTTIVKGVKAEGKDGAKKEDQEVVIKVYPKPFWDVKAAEAEKKKADEEAAKEAASAGEAKEEVATA